MFGGAIERRMGMVDSAVFASKAICSPARNRSLTAYAHIVLSAPYICY